MKCSNIHTHTTQFVMAPSGTTALPTTALGGRRTPVTLIDLTRDAWVTEVRHVTVNGVRQEPRIVSVRGRPVLRMITSFLPSSAPASRGATPAQIASLPTSIVPRKRKRATDEESAEPAAPHSCTICLDDYKGGEKMCTLPCSHAYHFKVSTRVGRGRAEG